MEEKLGAFAEKAFLRRSWEAASAPQSGEAAPGENEEEEEEEAPKEDEEDEDAAPERREEAEAAQRREEAPFNDDDDNDDVADVADVDPPFKTGSAGRVGAPSSMSRILAV